MACLDQSDPDGVCWAEKDVSVEFEIMQDVIFKMNLHVHYLMSEDQVREITMRIVTDHCCDDSRPKISFEEIAEALQLQLACEEKKLMAPLA